MIRIFIVFAAIAAFTATAWAQGLYWESKISGSPAGDETQQSFYMPKKFKTTTNGGEYIIIRLDAEKMITVNPTEKTYWEMTFQEIEAKMKAATPKVNERMEMLRKKLAEMPEEQRKMMEEKMGGMLSMSQDAKYAVTKPGESKTINSFSCSKYQVTRDGKDFLTLWTTKDVKDFNTMRDDFTAFTKRMMALNPMTGKGLGEEMQKVEGFPIQTDMTNGMSVVVTKVERRSTPDAEFAPPSGFKKVDPPKMGEK